MSSIFCPLCRAPGSEKFCEIPAQGTLRRYHQCLTCDMVFLHPDQRLDLPAEKKHYTLHHNDIADERYCNFLRQLSDPLMAKFTERGVVSEIHGLDFGSGPSPVMAALIGRMGARMESYDPIYATDTQVLGRTYDFVTCSEVAEHFYEPRVDFTRIATLLRPGAWLGVMTGMLDDWGGFPKWHYHRDVTHVSFYSHQTMEWIARHFNWHLEFAGTNVALFQKR